MTKLYLIPCDLKKKPLTRHGEKDASSDRDVVARWRAEYPGCNWAIATGPSGLIAVDEDCYKQVWTEGAVEIACGLQSFPETVEWRSARGGRVRIYRRPEGLVVPAKNGILPGVDVKCSTGYVLIPPSRNSEGASYEWVNPPSAVEVATAPQGLVDFCLARSRSAARGAAGKPRSTSHAGPVPHDQVYLRGGDGRWEFLRRLGGVLRREGCGYETIRAALTSFVASQCEYDETLRPEEVNRLVGWLVTNPVGTNARLQEYMIEENGEFYAVTEEPGLPEGEDK